MTISHARGRALHLATHSGWYRFEPENGGWRQTGRALTYWNATCLQVDPEDPARLFVGTEHSGLFVTENAGRDWRRAEPNVPRLTTTSMLALPGKLLVGTVPAALYCGAGGAWTELEGVRLAARGALFPPSPELGARTRFLASEPRPERRLYAGIEVGGMLISDDGGRRWRPANEGLEDPDVHEILASARFPGLVVAACGEGIFRSRDRGEHWEKVTPPGPRAYGTAVAEDGDGVIYLGIALGRPNTWLRRERADAAVFASTDGAASWRPVAEGLRGGVLDLCAGVDGRGAIAVTSEGDVYAVDARTCRRMIGDLPCINAAAVAA
ncbi:MAG TPA: hypothetical protein VNN77_12850 [candidate division Zixibacteria bacterium]|nr:hypothetical protein [candidate division Zixibacteria bacterium]